MAPPSISDIANRVVSMAENIGKDALSSVALVEQPKWKVLVAGSVSGLVVDTTLYPVDTIKSRLQSKSGFLKSGGFKHLYRGLPPVLAGSIPNAAIFFITYESIKNKLHQYKTFNSHGSGHVFNHMLAASCGEIASCIVRVPYEIVKMRSQTRIVQQGATNKPNKIVTNMSIVRDIIAKEGAKGFYRGFSSTIMRDLPFSALQFPLWERMKLNHLKKHKRPVTATESAYYGSIAGAIAAFITTPLDVAKTRIMLAEKNESLASGKVVSALKEVLNDRGVSGLFAGVVPRVLWISVGAAIFLGSYEKTIKLLN